MNGELIGNKKCSKCREVKPLGEFHKNKSKKDGRGTECKRCSNKYSKKYGQEHQEEGKEYHKEYYKEHKNEIRKRKGIESMYENKNCTNYLGIVIAERLCRHLFKEVKVMPNNNIGFDIICNKGKKIDVKSGCITLSKGKYPRWIFNIKQNTTADFFILVAFDNRTDLNPLYLWMIPGHEINSQGKASISPSTIDKWDVWKRDINDAQICCAEMKK